MLWKEIGSIPVINHRRDHGQCRHDYTAAHSMYVKLAECQGICAHQARTQSGRHSDGEDFPALCKDRATGLENAGQGPLAILCFSEKCLCCLEEPQL